MSQNRYNKYRMEYGGVSKNIGDFYPQTYYCPQPLVPVQTVQYVSFSTPTVSVNTLYPNNVMITNSHVVTHTVVPVQRCFIFNPYTRRYELP